MNDLKPCPFCGCGDTHPGTFGSCERCCAVGPNPGLGFSWNSRAAISGVDPGSAEGDRSVSMAVRPTPDRSGPCTDPTGDFDDNHDPGTFDDRKFCSCSACAMRRTANKFERECRDCKRAAKFARKLSRISGGGGEFMTQKRGMAQTVFCLVARCVCIFLPGIMLLWTAVYVALIAGWLAGYTP